MNIRQIAAAAVLVSAGSTSYLWFDGMREADVVGPPSCSTRSAAR